MLRIAIAAALVGTLAACSAAVSPVTLVERAVEARSASDIATDNRIVLEANDAMADIGEISASTEIYEGRLLVTGILDEAGDYQTFRNKIDAISGVKRLYWHVAQMSEAEQDADPNVISWASALELDAKVGISLIETKGVADVNYRVAVDPFSTVYLLGRARSQGELNQALTAVSGTSGVGKVVNYVEVRP